MCFFFFLFSALRGPFPMRLGSFDSSWSPVSVPGVLGPFRSALGADFCTLWVCETLVGAVWGGRIPLSAERCAKFRHASLVSTLHQSASSSRQFYACFYNIMQRTVSPLSLSSQHHPTVSIILHCSMTAVLIHIELHSTTTLNYTQLHCTTLNYTVLHWTILNYIELLWTTLNYTVPHWTTLKYIDLHLTTLNPTQLHWTSLNHTQLHSTLLNYTELHWTELHWTTLLHVSTLIHSLNYTYFIPLTAGICRHGSN